MSNPWEKTSLEMFKSAHEFYIKNNEHDNLISYLLLDVCVETLFKTYLSLDAEVSGVNSSFSERKKAIEGNFHQIVDQVYKDNENTLVPQLVEKNHIKYYHSIRNKLYHGGGGIIISREDVGKYLKLTSILLEQLLNISFKLNDAVNSKDISPQQSQILEELKLNLSRLKKNTERAIEKIDYRFLLPSFCEQLESYSYDSYDNIEMIDELIKEYFHFNTKNNLSEYYWLFDVEGKQYKVEDKKNTNYLSFKIIQNFEINDSIIIKKILYKDFLEGANNLYFAVLSSVLKYAGVNYIGDRYDWAVIIVNASQFPQRDELISDYEDEVVKINEEIIKINLKIEKFINS